MEIFKYEILLLILLFINGTQLSFIEKNKASQLIHSHQSDFHQKNEHQHQHLLNQSQHEISNDNFTLFKTYTKYILGVIGVLAALFSAVKISQKLKCCGSSCDWIDNVCCNCCCCFNNQCSCCDQQ